MSGDVSPELLTFTLKMVLHDEITAGMGRAKHYRKGTGLLAEVAVSNISHRSDALESLSRRTEMVGQLSCL